MIGRDERNERNERIGNVLLAIGVAALALGTGILLVEQRLTLASEIAYGSAGALLLVFVLVQPARTRTWVTSRQVRYGSNALLMTIALLAILGVANFLADRHPQRIDVTANRSLSLSEQTVDVLQTLESPLRVVGFFTSPSEMDRARDLLDQYRYYFPALETEFHDPTVEYSLALEWGVTEAYRPTVFVVYQEEQEIIHTVSELEVTSALVRLLRGSAPAVYFVTGHGEPDLEDYGEVGLSVLSGRLEQEGFQVERLNLLVTATVPADADAVVLMGPQTLLSDDEVDRLAQYIDDGGAAMILLEPVLDAAADTPALAEWLAERWGVAFRVDMVADPASYVYPYLTFPVATAYGTGPVGQRMAGVATYFPEARSIARVAEDSESSPSYDPLVQTSIDSWGETSITDLAYGEEDTAGPLDLAVTLEDPDGNGRLALFGDFHFSTNIAVQDFGNADLFINTLNWLTEGEELISIRPQEDVDRYVVMRSNLVRNTVHTVLVVLLPLLVLGVGGAVFAVRRLRR